MKFLRPAAALAFLLAMTGTSGSPAYAQMSKVLKIVAPNEVASLEPTSGAGFVFLRLGVGETLVAMTDDGGIRPGLAASWTPSEEGRAWTLALRPGVMFHDGSPLRASAVVGSLKRIADGSQGIKLAGITSIEADGDDKVVLRTSAPNAVLPALLTEAGTIILAPSSVGADGRTQAVIGTGPYRVTKIEGKVEVETRRHTAYWGPAPSIEAVTYVAATNPETRANIAAAGDADMVFNLLPSAVSRVQGGQM
ncbi:MAG: hypothetical protein FJX60_16845 [Alphaproteobacteria bacterium]|nr:hypothetical protein [Alphaproteobacteria bacterium]